MPLMLIMTFLATVGVGWLAATTRHRAARAIQCDHAEILTWYEWRFARRGLPLTSANVQIAMRRVERQKRNAPWAFVALFIGFVALMSWILTVFGRDVTPGVALNGATFVILIILMSVSAVLVVRNVADDELARLQRLEEPSK